MRKIAHIVNPVLVDDSSDLFLAQPVTFETMRIAKELARGSLDIQLFSAQYPEDEPVIPAGLCRTPDLDRSVLEFGSFDKPRKLPLLKDVLDRLYEATPAEYLVYTNVDIGLMPQFYLAVDRFIDAGFDAFVINRRTISNRFTSVEQLPLMYAEVGNPHRGWDCFVFRREAYPHYTLGAICLGAPRVGLALIANLVAHAERFKEFKDQHLTFHLGNDRGWQGSAYADYAEHNTREALSILSLLEKERGPFERSSPPGSYLFKRRRLGFAYELWTRYIHVSAGLKQSLARLLDPRGAQG
jgi:hypothetical protein